MAIEFTQISGAKSSVTTESSIVRLDSVGVDLLTAYNGQSIDRNLTAEEAEVFKQFVNNENLASLYAKVEGLADVVLTKSAYITQDSAKIISFSAVIMDCYLDTIVCIYPEGSSVLGSIEISKRTLKIPKAHECPYFGDEIAQLINGGTVHDRKLTAAELEYFTGLQDSEGDLRIKPSNFNMYMYFQKANYTKNFRLMYNTRYDSQVISIVIMFTTGMDSEDNTVGIIMSDLVTTNDFNNLEERVATLESSGGGSSSEGTNETFLQIDSFAYDFAALINNEDLYYSITRTSTEEEYILLNSLFDNINNGTNNINGIKIKLIVSSTLLFDGILRYTVRDQNGDMYFFSTIPLDNRTVNFYLNASHNGSGTTIDLTFTKIVLESESDDISKILYSDIFSSYIASATILPTNQQKIITPNSEEKEFLEKIIEMNKQGRLPSIILVGGTDNFTFTVSQCSNSMLRLHTFYGDGDISGLSISYVISQNRLFFERTYATSSGSSGGVTKTVFTLPITKENATANNTIYFTYNDTTFADLAIFISNNLSKILSSNFVVDINMPIDETTSATLSYKIPVFIQCAGAGVLQTVVIIGQLTDNLDSVTLMPNVVLLHLLGEGLNIQGKEESLVLFNSITNIKVELFTN